MFDWRLVSWSTGIVPPVAELTRATIGRSSRTVASGCLIAALPPPSAAAAAPASLDHPAPGSAVRTWLSLLAVLGAAATALLVDGLPARPGARPPSRSSSPPPCSRSPSRGSHLSSQTRGRVRVRGVGPQAFAALRVRGDTESSLTNAGATYTTDRFGFRTHVRGPWDATARTRIHPRRVGGLRLRLSGDETWPHLWRRSCELAAARR